MPKNFLTAAGFAILAGMLVWALPRAMRANDPVPIQDAPSVGATSVVNDLYPSPSPDSITLTGSEAGYVTLQNHSNGLVRVKGCKVIWSLKAGKELETFFSPWRISFKTCPAGENCEIDLVYTPEEQAHYVRQRTDGERMKRYRYAPAGSPKVTLVEKLEVEVAPMKDLDDVQVVKLTREFHWPVVDGRIQAR